MKQPSHAASLGRADALNRDCHCIAVDRDALRKSLEADLMQSGLPDKLLGVHSHLFANSPVFLSPSHIDTMARLIRAVETVVRNPAYRQAVFADAPAYAAQDFRPRGLFFGYDFHLGAQGPQLIEINTNAGGVLLNLHLAAAQQACCDAVASFFGGKTRIEDAENDLVAMVREEWKLQRPDRPLRAIAIVDSKPSEQFLYSEFLLFRSLFERHGIQAVVADPTELTLRDGSLRLGDQPIDLVYNRLTDFDLSEPESACLLEAYRTGLAVVTPSPQHYALYADKRNLVRLSDAAQLRSFGVDPRDIATIGSSLPKTVAVSRKNADELWANRKALFFKPVAGFGSRGSYRGSKLTRKVWDEILGAAYVAQEIVVPSERRLKVDGMEVSLKLDFRCVVYDGEIRQLSARLYRGQTTNMRTAGGGLATVFAALG